MRFLVRPQEKFVCLKRLYWSQVSRWSAWTRRSSRNLDISFMSMPLGTRKIWLNGSCSQTHINNRERFYLYERILMYHILSEKRLWYFLINSRPYHISITLKEKREKHQMLMQWFRQTCRKFKLGEIPIVHGSHGIGDNSRTLLHLEVQPGGIRVEWWQNNYTNMRVNKNDIIVGSCFRLFSGYRLPRYSEAIPKSCSHFIDSLGSGHTGKSRKKAADKQG